MRVWGAAALVLLLASSAVAAEPPALARARELYNAGDYDAAIQSAAEARGEAQFADAAALVLARARLERYRLKDDVADLAAAREALGTIRASALSPRDQVDLLIGFGQTLYIGQAFGAAAELFDTAWSRASILAPPDRVRLLDWWASSLEREAARRPADSRTALFSRIMARMEEELRASPGSAVANYWLAVSVRGTGDLDRAWDAAVAGWVRSTLAPATTDILRADLDRFVTEGLIPERVRTRPAREQEDAAAALRAQWDAVKQDWK